MTKKQIHHAEAERLYVNDQMSPEIIAEKLGISSRTINTWRSESGWDEKRRLLIDSRKDFYNELNNFAVKLMKSVEEDINCGIRPDTDKLYTLIRLLPMLPHVKRSSSASDEKQSFDGEKIMAVIYGFIPSKEKK